MTDIKEKALALVNEVRSEWGLTKSFPIDEASSAAVALLRAIEAHEATKREVSDAIEDAMDAAQYAVALRRFIIPKPKPDPLVEVIEECDDGTWETIPEYAEKFRAALEARGLKIVEKGL